ncbi:hypothetical protein HMPREF9554_01587 [Treponema phagedenis F0421]|nr:hypothetical protein HMPREF9554_01587 [Treponema phagedenis F0421]
MRIFEFKHRAAMAVCKCSTSPTGKKISRIREKFQTAAPMNV